VAVSFASALPADGLVIDLFKSVWWAGVWEDQV